MLIIDRDKKTFELPRPKNKLELSNSRTYRLAQKEQRVALAKTSGKVISIESITRRRASQL